MTAASVPAAIGFIGLGQLGQLVARHLLAWPGGLVVHDVRAETMEPFAARGAVAAPSVAAVPAAGASIICVMVRDDEQVTEVVDQLLPATPADTVIAVHSTIGPGTAEGLAAHAENQRVWLLDAPVTGGPAGARAGTLAVMVGGPEGAVERCREPFACFSDRVVRFGDVGSATRAKIARNLITFASYVAVGEAQRLAAAAGVDLVRLGEVVRYSDSVTSGPGSIMLRDDAGALSLDDPWHDVMSHTRDLGDKDLTLALELAEQLGVDLPFTDLARSLLGAALGVPQEDDRDR